MRQTPDVSTESAVEACRAIQHYWTKLRDVDPVYGELLLRDYLSKARGLSAQDLAELDRVALNMVAPDLEFGRTEASSMPQYDVGILTIQPNEWAAVRHVFDLADKLIGYGPEGQHYYATELKCDSTKGAVKAVFGVVGEGLNVQAGLATQDLLSRFSIDAVFLVGMAIGLEKTTTRGDVVVGRKVMYYEPGTLTDDELRPRQYDLALPQSMLHMLNDFRPLNPWRKQLLAEYRRADNELMPDDFDFKRPVKVNSKREIASGEKIIEGSLLKELVEQREERIVAADQESWGFALAAKSHPWMVFRGIADHGMGRDTSYQFASTVAAAFALKFFIETAYVPSSYFATV